MTPNIQDKFDRLTRKHEMLLETLDSLSTGELNFKAGQDKWSVVEVVEHLVIVEDDLLHQLSRNTMHSTLDSKLRSF